MIRLPDFTRYLHFCYQVVFEDRTPAHADHVGFGPDRMTTAAVGILKAIHCSEHSDRNRITKVRAFDLSSGTYLDKNILEI